MLVISTRDFRANQTKFLDIRWCSCHSYNTIVAEQEGKIYLLLIYDKADASSVKMNVVKQIVKDLGF